MNRLIPAALVLFAATASAQRRPVPPPQPLQLHTELRALLTDLNAVEKKVARLGGDFRTIKVVNRGIGAMRTRIKRLLETAPPTVQAQIVVSLGTPVPPPIVVLQPSPGAPPTRPIQAPPAGRAMGRADFGRLVAAIGKESFSSDKLRVLRSAAAANHVEIAQVIQLVKAFEFSKDQVECVRIVKDRIVDRKNAYLLYDAFTYSADKRKVREILGE